MTHQTPSNSNLCTCGHPKYLHQDKIYMCADCTDLCLKFKPNREQAKEQPTANDRLDEILTNLPQYNLGTDPITDKFFTPEDVYAIYPELKEARAAITRLLVLERWEANKRLHDCRIRITEDHVGMEMIPDIYAVNNMRESQLEKEAEGHLTT